MSPPDPAPPGAAQDSRSALSRPASLWPESGQAGAAASSQFVPTRFDPLSEERSRLDAQASATFDVCHPALALRAVLLVQAVLALVALAGAGDAPQWLARQAVLAFGGVAATLLWLVVLCALRQALLGWPPAARSTCVLLLGALAASAAWAPLAWAGLAQGGVLQGTAVALGGLAMAGVLWAWLDLRARIWHPANASARLAELQSRIRPHFLFNALNTALALVRLDPARAEGVLEDLAELFRVAISDSREAVTLAEEVEVAQRYLAIEQIRFGDRLKVSWELDPAAGRARVPPLLLQPLVENAVRHGVEPNAAGGTVRIRTQVRLGRAVLSIANSVPAEPSRPGNGMALRTVRERLRLMHDVAAQFDTRLERGVFRVQIVVPL